MPLQGIEIEERPWRGSADARTFAQQPGPGNPDVGPNGSTEAQGLRRPPGAAAQSAAPSTLSRAGQGIRDAWGAMNQGPGYFGPQPQPAAPTGLVGKTWGAAKSAGAGALRLAGPAIGVALEGKGVYDVAKDPNSSGMDVATQVAEGAGKMATGVLGAKAGGALGMLGGPFAPVTVPLGALAGGAAGYFGGEKAIHGLRGLVGSNPASPAEQARARQATPAAPATAPVATPVAQGNTLPVSSTPVKFGPTDGAPLPQPNGNILRQGNSYSGMNVGGNPEDLRINNSPLRRGTVTSMGGNPGDLNSAQRMAMDQRAHDTQMQSIGLRQQLMDRNAPTPGMATVGASPSSLFSRTPEQAARDAAVSASSITNGQGLSGRQRKQFAQADARLAFDRENSGQQNTATLRGQDLNFGATTRGQDLGHDASMFGHEVSRMNNKAQMSNALLQMQRDQSNKDREFEQSSRKTESELASAAQTQGWNARNNAAADFKAFAPGKDGISMESPELSARSFDAVRKILPGFDSMTEGARNERYPDAKILQKLFLRTQDQKQMGIDKINPLKPRDPALDAMPNLKGGVLKQQKLTGLATPGGSYGNWYIEHNGRDIPLGADMSARELEIVRHHLGTGEWLGAPKNIQKGN